MDQISAMTLDEIESEIRSSMRTETMRWTRIASLMDEVQTRSLYADAGYKSFTAWVNDMAARIPCAVSLLWTRRKAGRYYAEYETRAREEGRNVPSLEDAHISAETLILCQKIAGANDSIGDDLVGRAIDGDLTKKQLSAAWKEKRESGGYVCRSRHDLASAGTGTESDEDAQRHITEGVMTAALDSDRNWLMSHMDVQQGTDAAERYRTLPQFTVTGSGASRRRRMDALVLETYTTPGMADAAAVHMHAVEIKVTASDLSGDEKMGDYADYADYFWLFVPASLQADAMTCAAPLWGVLVYDGGQIRAAQAAAYRPGGHRSETLERALRRML